MALTISRVTGADHVAGNKRVKIRDITFDSSYPTGGESLTASDVGLKKIYFVRGSQVKNSDGTSAHSVVYDYTNSKLVAHQFDGSAAGVQSFEEVANTADLSTFSGRFEFVGH